MRKFIKTNTKGEASFLTIFIIVIMFLLLSFVLVFSETWSSATKIRTSLQNAVNACVVDAFDETYVGQREGYTGSYDKNKAVWTEIIVAEKDLYEFLKSEMNLVQKGTSFYSFNTERNECNYVLSNIKIKAQACPKGTSGEQEKYAFKTTITADVEIIQDFKSFEGDLSDFTIKKGDYKSIKDTIDITSKFYYKF